MRKCVQAGLAGWLSWSALLCHYPQSARRNECTMAGDVRQSAGGQLFEKASGAAITTVIIVVVFGSCAR